MLTLKILVDESFNEATSEFVLTEIQLELEHSLVSLSKWEAFWEKPFLTDEMKTAEETLSYIKYMVLTPNVPDEVYDLLKPEHMDEINAYLAKKMTATWFNDRNKKPNTEVITSELIYYWMVAYTIPFECQHWHLNRLLTLVKVCNEKNAPEEKMSQEDMIAERRRLNEERRKQFQTQG